MNYHIWANLLKMDKVILKDYSSVEVDLMNKYFPLENYPTEKQRIKMVENFLQQKKEISEEEKTALLIFQERFNFSPFLLNYLIKNEDKSLDVSGDFLLSLFKINNKPDYFLKSIQYDKIVDEIIKTKNNDLAFIYSFINCSNKATPESKVKLCNYIAKLELSEDNKDLFFMKTLDSAEYWGLIPDHVFGFNKELLDLFFEYLETENSAFYNRQSNLNKYRKAVKDAYGNFDDDISKIRYLLAF